MSIPTKPIPEKVIVWLSDPLIIEAQVFVPPENTRIAQVDNPPSLSRHDVDTAKET